VRSTGADDATLCPDGNQPRPAQAQSFAIILPRTFAVRLGILGGRLAFFGSDSAEGTSAQRNGSRVAGTEVIREVTFAPCVNRGTARPGNRRWI